MNFEFEHEGRIVRPGQVMHVAPSYHWCAGDQGAVERFHGDSVTLRSSNGAVPTVPLSALSWEPHPETVAMEEMARAGILRPSSSDVSLWLLAKAQPQSNEQLLAETQRRGLLAPLQGAIGAMHDHLDRTGALDSDMTAYLAYRLRREEMAVSGLPDAAERAAIWQEMIDEMEADGRATGERQR